MVTQLPSEPVLDPPDIATRRGPPASGIHHFDRRGECTSMASGRRRREAGVRPSKGSAGDWRDNARRENLFATLKSELRDRHFFRSQEEASRGMFEFVGG